MRAAPDNKATRPRRAPHGARGLKCGKIKRVQARLDVAPRTGRVD